MDAGTRTILVPGRAVYPSDDDSVPMQEIAAIHEKMVKTTQKLEADFSKVETKIHRFPRGLQGIDGHYIEPSVVAIGPYHHGSLHLEKMEEVKLAAAYYLCRSSGHTTEEVCEKVRSVASAARACYDADDPSLVSLGDAEFANMMFLDGCFLLQYMVDDTDMTDMTPPLMRKRMTLSTGPSIQKDIFLLENQIPWLVLDTLMEFMPIDLRKFFDDMGAKFLPGNAKPKNVWRRMRWGWGCISATAPPRGEIGIEYKPPHLLGLLRFTQVGGMPEHMVNYGTAFPRSSLSISAVELEQMGVRLAATASTPWFGNMAMRRRHLFGELSLSPLFLNEVTACWLINIAAVEASAPGVSWESSDVLVVSSYLSVLAMLMNREEDVQQMRAKHLLYSTFSDKQALRFFKGLAQHLRFGQRYFVVLERIEAYKRHRPVRIAAHKFVYNYYTAIVAVLSAAGVLVSILKALYSIKKT